VYKRQALKKGEMSGYHFIFLEMDKETVGYACFGPIPATEFSYDLYWIAVHKEYQNMGLGRILIVETEKAIQKMGGRRIYIETSGRVQYVSTRNFYIGCGYKEEAVMEDFYSPGDPKYIYLKVI
jgi:ribosomal protein S18 acetylase RimI-like enzyme